MKPCSLVGLRLCLLGCCLLSTQFLRAAESRQLVEIVEADGLVEVSTDGARWVPTREGTKLQPQDKLRTGPNSRAALRWSDSSVVPFGSMTAIEVMPPQKAETSFSLRLLKGVLSFFHRGKSGAMRAVMPPGVAGIEGTEFVIAVDDNNQATVWVIDGKVTFTNEFGPPLVLTNGEQAVAAMGRAPQRVVAGFVVNHVLQWAFYYPAVLDLRDVAFSADEQRNLADSLAAYRAGDLLAALDKFGKRDPASEAEQIYYAALLLSVGEVARAEPVLTRVDQAAASEQHRRDAVALRQLISTVRRESFPDNRSPESATELLAASYQEQSLARGDETLMRALSLARRAATNSPEFSFAWARVAELEFSFGNTRAANEAVTRSLSLAPRNAQALALKGFLTAAENKTHEALDWFERALEVDRSLGNAWLGRGLVRIRRGDVSGGREDLLIAAALEPRRAQLRSYLGKAYAETGQRNLALHELELAKQIDPYDPTAWLYSALVKADHNRINEAISDLERAQELSDNRNVYRSSLLLDEDRAVRSANLARVYADVGMEGIALFEAARAVAIDYGNYSAHLFLADSFEVRRRSTPYEQRFETPAFNEFLLASLLGPADGRVLSQPLSQQEYTRLFERDTIGLSSVTEYLSHGAWAQSGVQYGTLPNFSYALEADYLSDPGQTAHSEIERRILTAKAKFDVTQRDGLLMEIQELRQQYGDLGSRFDPATRQGTVHTREDQQPDLFVGWDHRWSSAQRTLFLFSRVDDSFHYTNRHGATFLETESGGAVDGLVPVDLSQQYRSDLLVDSTEVQHLVTCGAWQTILGTRWQLIEDSVRNRQTILDDNAGGYEDHFADQPGTIIVNQRRAFESWRSSSYIYEQWRVLKRLQLIAGMSFDYQQQPKDSIFAPLQKDERVQSQISPKAGLVLDFTKNSTLRAAYSESLGGVDLDQSIRLEPTQVAGFPQTFRTLFPDSLVGGVAGARQQAASIGFQQRFPTHTYLSLNAEVLESTIDHHIGVFRRDPFTQQGPQLLLKRHLEMNERSAEATLYQMLGPWFTAGIEYRISDARLNQRYGVKPAFARPLNGTDEGELHTVTFRTIFRHPTGFFVELDPKWWSQKLTGKLASLEQDSFWQVDVTAGYRWPRRRAEIAVGILNLTDEGYHLHPINFYPDLPRERTFYARLQLNF